MKKFTTKNIQYLYAEGPVTGHLGTVFLGFPVSESER